MSTRERLISAVKSMNGSLDVQFLESLSEKQLKSYSALLKAIRTSREDVSANAPVHAGAR